MAIEEDLKPLMNAVFAESDEPLRRCRADATPLGEAAFCLYNLGEWLEQNQGALPESAESFGDIVRFVYHGSWDEIESLASSDFERITTGGSFRGGDIIISAVECILAATKCDCENKTREAWSYAVDARHLVAVIIGGWLTNKKVKQIHATANADRRWANDPVHNAKELAKALWKERHDGAHPDLFPNYKLAAECVKRWPKLKQTTIERKWIPEWEREIRAGSPS